MSLDGLSREAARYGERVSASGEQVGSAPPPQHPSRVTGGSPGLTSSGVVVVVLAGSLVGLLLDGFTGGGIGWLFGVFFVASCVYAALQVRRRDLLAAVIVPPLVFFVLMLGRAILTGSGGLGSRAAATLLALIDEGPQLWAGTGAAAVIVLVRHYRARPQR